jgi:hypothetical protein
MSVSWFVTIEGVKGGQSYSKAVGKNWEIVPFHLRQIFCSVSFRWGSQCFYETTGLEPNLYSIATHSDIV